LRRIFHRLVSLDEARRVLENLVAGVSIGVEEVPIEGAVGRVLAEDVHAHVDYPPFDRSEVDGYAVRASDTYGADEDRPVRLRVVGSIEVGSEPKIEVGPGEAVEIATGAPLPRGATAVVMVEHTRRVNNGFIEVYRAVAPRENIALAGSDISKGELVAPRGHVVRPIDLAIMAAVGIRRVKVFKRPRIAVVSTGNELVEPGNPLPLGCVYDVNGFSITALLRSWGADAVFVARVGDDELEVSKLITELARSYDMVVLSGGTSAGLGDVVYRAIERAGKIVVHGIRVKPGKPTVIGIVEGKPVVGLPGFPFSALCIALYLLRPVIASLCGYRARSRRIRVELVRDVVKRLGRAMFIPLALRARGERVLALPIPYRSGNVSTLARADAVAMAPEDVERIPAGTVIDAELIEDLSDRIAVVGSHDIALIEILHRAGIIDETRLVWLGSLEGLRVISTGFSDIAPTHLVDEVSGVYNKPFIERMGLKDRVVLIAGYRRRLVLAFARGNPKNIRGFEDLLRDDVLFINRNRGSGTRFFIDRALREIASKLGTSFGEVVKRVRGYEYEVSTHSAVAAAIASGRADAGVCIEYAAVQHGLDYIPLAWEEYDFAVLRESLNDPRVARFIEYLRSDECRELLRSLRGYEPHPRMGFEK